MSSSGRTYPKIAGLPVLVDFERSVLDRDQLFSSSAISPVAREAGRARRLLKRYALHGEAETTADQNAQAFLREAQTDSSKRPLILIIGGGTKGIGTNRIYDGTAEIVSFDIYVSQLTQFVADATNIPLKSGIFDGVWVQYTLEHVLEPWLVAAEIHRILKPGGVVYSETPFLQPVHEAQFDFTRFTHSGHRYLFKNFTEIVSGIAQGHGAQILLTIEHLVRALTRSKRAGQAAKLLYFWMRYLDRVTPRRMTLDASSSFFFLGKKSHVAMSPREIVYYYDRSG